MRRLASGVRQHNLPQPLSSFIGREHEIAEARRLLETTRLLTLTGTGGVGKTRLGHEVAAAVLDDCEDGVWLVELAALADPMLVPHAVAASLGVREEPERPATAALVDAIRPRRLLLVLDNCEHLIEACAELADTLLRACPELRILATSRQPFGITGETTFHVPSLATSSLARGTDAHGPVGHQNADNADFDSPSSNGAVGEVAQADAVRLFFERARAAAPSFALAEHHVEDVEQICRRLDGIPLAIELATSRVAVLSPKQIVSRLDDRFRLLTGGSRTALPRHRTLRALIDWSHDALDQHERILFRRLAVFSGGWSLEAAETICGGDGLESADILDMLSHLVATSMVVTDEHDDEIRYRFLESLRAYAAGKLHEAGEEQAVRERHLTWLIDRAERAETELTGPQQVWWLRRLDEDDDNLRAALAWAAGDGRADDGLRLAGALFRYWSTRGAFSEGHHWLTTLLDRATVRPLSEASARARARACEAASRLAAKHGDHRAAQDLLTEALAVAREHGDRPRVAAGTHGLGCLARVRGDYTAARQHLHEARELFRQIGDLHGAAETSVCLGVVATSEGNLRSAQSLFEQGLDAYRALGDRRGMAATLNNLGEIALEHGDLTTARALGRESLTLAGEIGDRERVAIAFATLAGVAAARGQAERALLLAAAAMSLREALQKSSPPAWRARFMRWLEPARLAMTDDARSTADATGRAMPLDTAISYALGLDDEPVDVPPAVTLLRDASAPEISPRCDGPRSRLATSTLTQREVEVAALVARGLTNRQIASELVITEGTAANHVKHILARLVLDSRVQIATWAIERGLHRLPHADPSEPTVAPRASAAPGATTSGDNWRPRSAGSSPISAQKRQG